ncbi:LOW QUALITY PROTEIN: hypothetical protein CVT25_011890 [Psilocybe cyanescens]|uniref:Uncharacterized protein n=1 Tax=Psilocybe cyanescens TaxID=93625 RepID=A0A409WIU3_PSICY|nr:LOW QUALITY PROTEIN: hypothetical protein CVT25_011890 [Psilocybe cyanescens]
MVDKHLSAALHLRDDCDDEAGHQFRLIEVSSTLVALLTSAVHDKDPRMTLSEIYQIITTTGAPEYLDPLNTLQPLLTCDDGTARDIISVIAQYSSAKEVVMAAQEALERLERSLEPDSEEDDDEVKGQREDTKHNLALSQIIVLIDTYASAIPRITLRQKSAADTLRPLCKELGTLVGLVTSNSTRSQGLALLSSILTFVEEVGQWTDAVDREKPDDLKAFVPTWASESAYRLKTIKKILNDLLDHSLLACERFIKANIAQRTLEECYPRLALRSRITSNWQEGAESMSKLLVRGFSCNHTRSNNSLQDVCDTLGLSVPSSPCSTTHLVISAHRPPADINSELLLSYLLPMLITSFQTNTFLDESLAVLVKALHDQEKGRDLPHDITLPLSGLLPSIASVHPDPAIRHQAFRVLSLLLSLCDPQLRFQHLVELTRDSEFPQMRVASVGLVKESLLNGLSLPRHDQNPLLGPLFLRTFGPILFRPDPPDLFGSALTLKDFQETHEPGRLVECLSLFYVLLLRDERNLTGIRDKDVIKSIDHNLLAPLRRNLAQWMDDPSISKDLHDITGVVPLQISLERIDAALAS